jgi:hypothetical protein
MPVATEVPPEADTVIIDAIAPPDDMLTDAGLNDTVGPGGEIMPIRETVPLNPLRLVSVIVRVVADP